MLFHKFHKIIPVYPVMPLWEPECWQSSLFNPLQYGYLTYTTMLGNETGSDIFGTFLLGCIFQIGLHSSTMLPDSSSFKGFPYSYIYDVANNLNVLN